MSVPGIEMEGERCYEVHKGKSRDLKYMKIDSRPYSVHFCRGFSGELIPQKTRG